MQIRKLTEADAQIFWDLRLQALRESPHAFGSSYEDSVTRPLSTAIARLRNEDASPDNLVLGAFASPLVGIVGFQREQGMKVQHKGFIWGMYVTPAARGRGIGKALMRHVIAYASSLPGLEQIHLAVSVPNPQARALYLSLGFQIYGTEPHALKLPDRYLDEELMVLSLVSAEC